MSLSNNGHDSGNGVVLEKSLLEAFTVLRNIKNVITGKINSAPFLYELHGGFIFLNRPTPVLQESFFLDHLAWTKANKIGTTEVSKSLTPVTFTPISLFSILNGSHSFFLLKNITQGCEFFPPLISFGSWLVF